jgi:hypothetical protein
MHLGKFRGYASYNHLMFSLLQSMIVQLYQLQDACLLGALEDGLNALLNIEVCAHPSRVLVINIRFQKSIEFEYMKVLVHWTAGRRWWSFFYYCCRNYRNSSYAILNSYNKLELSILIYMQHADVNWEFLFLKYYRRHYRNTNLYAAYTHIIRFSKCHLMQAEEALLRIRYCFI